MRRLCAPCSPRPHDYSADGFNDWAFMTTHSWDENPSGEWVLEIENTSEANNYGMGDTRGSGGRRGRARVPVGSQCRSLWPPPPPGIGTLTKFTLVLYGTAPEGLPTPPESSGCKMLTSSQACVGQ